MYNLIFLYNIPILPFIYVTRRTVHSLAKLLGYYGSSVQLQYVAPPSLSMPDDVVSLVESMEVVF